MIFWYYHLVARAILDLVVFPWVNIVRICPLTTFSFQHFVLSSVNLSDNSKTSSKYCLLHFIQSRTSSEQVQQYVSYNASYYATYNVSCNVSCNLSYNISCNVSCNVLCNVSYSIPNILDIPYIIGSPEIHGIPKISKDSALLHICLKRHQIYQTCCNVPPQQSSHPQHAPPQEIP